MTFQYSYIFVFSSSSTWRDQHEYCTICITSKKATNSQKWIWKKRISDSNKVLTVIPILFGWGNTTGRVRTLFDVRESDISKMAAWNGIKYEITYISAIIRSTVEWTSSSVFDPHWSVSDVYSVNMNCIISVNQGRSGRRTQLDIISCNTALKLASTCYHTLAFSPGILLCKISNHSL